MKENALRKVPNCWSQRRWFSKTYSSGRRAGQFFLVYFVSEVMRKVFIVILLVKEFQTQVRSSASAVHLPLPHKRANTVLWTSADAQRTPGLSSGRADLLLFCDIGCISTRRIAIMFWRRKLKTENLGIYLRLKVREKLCFKAFQSSLKL